MRSQKFKIKQAIISVGDLGIICFTDPTLPHTHSFLRKGFMKCKPENKNASLCFVSEP